MHEGGSTGRTLKAEKAKRGKGLQDEKMKPGKYNENPRGKMIKIGMLSGGRAKLRQE